MYELIGWKSQVPWRRISCFSDRTSARSDVAESTRMAFWTCSIRRRSSRTRSSSFFFLRHLLAAMRFFSRLRSVEPPDEPERARSRLGFLADCDVDSLRTGVGAMGSRVSLTPDSEVCGRTCQREVHFQDISGMVGDRSLRKRRTPMVGVALCPPV